MKKKLLINSILSVIMCLSVIAGSTFAVFTADQKVNVAVNAATVNVVATVDESTIALSSEYGKNVQQTEAYYENGKIVVNNMAPGDIVDFEISIYNKSSIDVQYAAVFKVDGAADLVGQLEISAVYGGEEVVFTGASEAKDVYRTLAPTDTPEIPVMTIPVKLHLPKETSNTYQGGSLEFYFGIEAIQGNAPAGPQAVFNTFAQEDIPTPDKIQPLGFGFPAPVGEVELEAAYSFTDQETAESLAVSPYKDWICDFVIECDQDLAENELGLAGQYDLFGNDWVAFLSPMAVKANQKIPMMLTAGLQLTYEGVCSGVEVFNCGVFRGIDPDTTDELDAMVGMVDGEVEGKTVTVRLCMFNLATFEPKLNAKIAEFQAEGKTYDEALMLSYDWQWYDDGVDYLIVNTQFYTFGPVA